MKVKEKYINKSMNDKSPDGDKVVISDDAFAICESINELKFSIDNLRSALQR